MISWNDLWQVLWVLDRSEVGLDDLQFIEGIQQKIAFISHCKNTSHCWCRKKVTGNTSILGRLFGRENQDSHKNLVLEEIKVFPCRRYLAQGWRMPATNWIPTWSQQEPPPVNPPSAHPQLLWIESYIVTRGFFSSPSSWPVWPKFTDSLLNFSLFKTVTKAIKDLHSFGTQTIGPWAHLGPCAIKQRFRWWMLTQGSGADFCWVSFLGGWRGLEFLDWTVFFSHFNESKMNEEEELYSKNLILC